MKKIGKIILISLVILLTAVFIFTRFFFPKFYMSEQDHRNYCLKQGQITPNFYTYQVGARNIHYLHIGNDTLPLVVFIHGSPGSSDAFKEFMADTTLSQEIQLIAVDRPGFGDSDYGWGEPSLQEQAALLKPILEKHRANKVILVGHSLGGPLTFRMTMDYPNLIDGIVSIAGSLDPNLEPNEWFRPMLAVAPLQWFLNGSFVASNTEIMGHQSALKRMLPLWEKVTSPTIVIQGTKDNFVPVGNADFAKKMLTNCKYLDVQVVEGADHFILWTDIQITKNAISTLLKQ